MIIKIIKSTLVGHVFPRHANIWLLLLKMLLLPVMLRAAVVTSFDMPDTGYVSNVAVDIIGHNGGIWLATGEGVNFSYDNGVTWFSYDNSNGLVSNNISAFYSIPTATGQRIWVASNHSDRIEGSLMVLSDGVSFSDDNGNTWTQIIFDSTGLNIPYVWGGDRSIFDITGHYDANNQPYDNWLFFTAFAGGFLASRDGGISWRRIYPSALDSVQYNTTGQQPSLRNRYFSAATDTSHGDTLSVWTGTAEGIFQYIFAEPKDKPFSKQINRIVFCDSCGNNDSNYVYFGGDAGFTRGAKTGAPFISRFKADGLPGSTITAMVDFGGKLFVGTMDAAGDSSTGLAVSADFGDSFTAQTGFVDIIGINKKISDFAVIQNRLYLAAEEAGLYVSNDTGLSWMHIFVDSSDITATNRRNVIHALNAWGDTLRIGTDSGLVQLYLDPTGNFDPILSRFHIFDEGAFSSTKVIRIKTQVFNLTDIIWTVNRPLTIDGTPIVGRSDDGGISWDTMQVGINTYDINFFGDTTFVVGDAGVRFATDSTNPGSIYEIKEIVDSVTVDSFTDDTITVMEVLGDTVIFGTDNGFAISLDRGDNYNIYRINKDTLAADVVLQYSSSIFGISGDFIPAIGVQYFPDEFAVIYTSNRPAFGGSEGISAGYMLLDTATLSYVRIWSSIYDKFAWNFAFDSETVFAATNGGLIYSHVDSAAQGVWDTLSLEDSLGNALVLPGTPVFGVEVVDSFLWVGTDDRTVRVNLNNLSEQTSFFVIDSSTPADEVYAYPVPFSYARNQVVEFHFVVENDTYVTLEIYDFAMNLVQSVIDNEFFPAGIYPTFGSGRKTWDGFNNRGDKVAVGMYYFKVEYSTGEVFWGKLAVIP